MNALGRVRLYWLQGAMVVARAAQAEVKIKDRAGIHKPTGVARDDCAV